MEKVIQAKETSKTSLLLGFILLYPDEYVQIEDYDEEDTKIREFFEKDHTSESFQLAHLGTKSGDLLAHCFIAMSYKNGFGTEKNIALAIKHFLLAADQGHGNSMLELFMMSKANPEMYETIKIETIYSYVI